MFLDVLYEYNMQIIFKIPPPGLNDLNIVNIVILFIFIISMFKV